MPKKDGYMEGKELAKVVILQQTLLSFPLFGYVLEDIQSPSSAILLEFF